MNNTFLAIILAALVGFQLGKMTNKEPVRVEEVSKVAEDSENIQCSAVEGENAHDTLVKCRDKLKNKKPEDKMEKSEIESHPHKKRIIDHLKAYDNLSAKGDHHAAHWHHSEAKKLAEKGGGGIGAFKTHMSENKMEKKEETKHDRCVADVKENSPGVGNAHAVCSSVGVPRGDTSPDKKDMHKAEKDAIDQFMKKEKFASPEAKPAHAEMKKNELCKAEGPDFGVRSFDHRKKNKSNGKHWTVAHEAPKADKGYHTHTHHFDDKAQASKYAEKVKHQKPEILDPSYDER